MVAGLIKGALKQSSLPENSFGCRILMNICMLNICDTTHTGCGIRGVCGYFLAISSCSIEGIFFTAPVLLATSIYTIELV